MFRIKIIYKEFRFITTTCRVRCGSVQKGLLDRGDWKDPVERERRPGGLESENQRHQPIKTGVSL